MILSTLIIRLYTAVEKNNFYEAIELNKEITKILDTYKECC